MKNYSADAMDDAIDMVRNFKDAIIEKLISDDEASTDLYNDYQDGDSYHHETHVDKKYDLQESAELLNDLDKYEETDSGLWEGQEPRKAIATQAAFTYGNAVYDKWRELVEEINGKWKNAEGVQEKFDDEKNALAIVIIDEVLNDNA